MPTDSHNSGSVVDVSLSLSRNEQSGSKSMAMALRNNGTKRHETLSKNTVESSLLSRPITEIIDEIQPKLFPSAFTSTPLKQSHRQTPSSLSAGDHLLWVDKYRPQSFCELLGDSNTNRRVLHWLLEWKSFLNNIKSTKPNGLLLISGLPGVGKSTLVNVLTSHAGFRHLSINASEIRTAKELVKIMNSSLNSNSIAASFGQNNNTIQPTCLILEEIDGACIGSTESTHAIHSILETLFPKASSHRNAPAMPVIALCNDVYSKVLRPLRVSPLVECLEYKCVDQSVLISRLKFIMKSEKFAIDSRVLHRICELTQNDIRSALNTLQLMKDSLNTSSGNEAVWSAVGCKDLSKTVFDVWNAVFARHTGSRGFHSKTREFDRKEEHEEARLRMELERMLRECDAMDVVVNGCYENVHCGYRGSDMDSIVDALEYHCVFDSDCLMFDNEYRECVVMKYGFTMNAMRRKRSASHSVSAVRMNQNVRWTLPSQGHMKLNEKKKIVESNDIFVNGMGKARLVRSISKRDSVLDVVPALIQLLLLLWNKNSEWNEDRMNRMYETMREYGIKLKFGSKSFDQEMKANRRQVRFEPDLECIGVFESCLRNGESRDADKELLMNAMEMVKNKPKLKLRQHNDRATQIECEQAVADSMQQLSEQNEAEICLENQSKLSVLFKFNEGHTNAVKRPLYMRHFS